MKGFEDALGSAVAIEICCRSGIGRVHHLAVGQLWVQESLGRFISGLPAGAAPQRRLAPPSPTPPVLTLIHKPGQVQSNVVAMLPGITRVDPRYWKTNLLMSVFGGSDSLRKRPEATHDRAGCCDASCDTRKKPASIDDVIHRTTSVFCNLHSDAPSTYNDVCPAFIALLAWTIYFVYGYKRNSTPARMLHTNSCTTAGFLSPLVAINSEIKRNSSGWGSRESKPQTNSLAAC